MYQIIKGNASRFLIKKKLKTWWATEENINMAFTSLNRPITKTKYCHIKQIGKRMTNDCRLLSRNEVERGKYISNISHSLFMVKTIKSSLK